MESPEVKPQAPDPIGATYRVETGRYVVDKLIDDTWYIGGTWDDPCVLAKAMWELGLQRPDYDDIRVRKEVVEVPFEVDEALVQYLVKKCGVSRGGAMVALNHFKGSVIHACDALSSEIYKAQCSREAREYGIG